MFYTLGGLDYAQYSGLLLPLCLVYTILVFLTKGFNKNGNANDILKMEIPLLIAMLAYVLITSITTIPIIYSVLNSFFVFSIVILILSIPFGFMLGYFVYKLWCLKHKDFILTKEFEELYILNKNKKNLNTYSILCIITTLSFVVMIACFILSFVATYQVYIQGLCC